MDKKRIESKHFKGFRKLLVDFPEGEVWHEDSPDFLIYTNDGLVGVEHRQLFQPDHPEKNSIQARESQVDELLAIAQEHAELRGMPPIHISLFFSKQMKSGLNKKQKLALGRDTATAVYKNLPNESETLELDYSNCHRLGFPDEVDHVFLSRYDGDDQHRWRSIEAGKPISDCRDALQKAICEKAQRLPSYRHTQNLTECWLLIVANGLNPSSFFEPNELSTNHMYTSPFDRTYFFNFAGPPPSLIKLKTKSTN